MIRYCQYGILAFGNEVGLPLERNDVRVCKTVAYSLEGTPIMSQMISRETACDVGDEVARALQSRPFDDLIGLLFIESSNRADVRGLNASTRSA